MEDVEVRNSDEGAPSDREGRRVGRGRREKERESKKEREREMGGEERCPTTRKFPWRSRAHIVVAMTSKHASLSVTNWPKLVQFRGSGSATLGKLVFCYETKGSKAQQFSSFMNPPLLSSLLMLFPRYFFFFFFTSLCEIGGWSERRDECFAWITREHGWMEHSESPLKGSFTRAQVSPKSFAGEIFLPTQPLCSGTGLAIPRYMGKRNRWMLSV